MILARNQVLCANVCLIGATFAWFPRNKNWGPNRTWGPNPVSPYIILTLYKSNGHFQAPQTTPLVFIFTWVWLRSGWTGQSGHTATSKKTAVTMICMKDVGSWVMILLILGNGQIMLAIGRPRSGTVSVRYPYMSSRFWGQTCFSTSESFWHAKNNLVSRHQEVGLGQTPPPSLGIFPT